MITFTSIEIAADGLKFTFVPDSESSNSVRPLHSADPSLEDAMSKMFNVDWDTKEGVFSCRVTAHKSLSQVRLRLLWEIPGWSRDCFLMAPASAYAGNRFGVRPVTTYPPEYTERSIEGYPKDRQIDVPRLARDGHPSCFEDASCNLAAASVGLFVPQAETALCIRWRSDGDPTGISFSEGRVSGASLEISTPPARQYRATLLGRVPADDEPGSIAPGRTVSVEGTIASAPARDVGDLYALYRTEVFPRNPEPLPAGSVPLSTAKELVAMKFDTQNWSAKHAAYLVELPHALHRRYPVTLGWVGGGTVLVPFSTTESEKTAIRVRENIARIVGSMQASSGLFYGVADDARGYGDVPTTTHNRLRPHSWQLIRRSVDVAQALIRILQLNRADVLHPTVGDDALMTLVEKSVERCIQALHQIWLRYGEIGFLVDVESAEIRVAGGFGAALLPAVMNDWGDACNNNEWYESATALFGALYDEFLREGFTCGGPGDALLAADSESAYALLESAVSIAERAPTAANKAAVRTIADYVLTWITRDESPFPGNSTYGRLGINSRGSVWANIQNKQPAPTFCTASGLALLRAYRVTGEAAYIGALGEVLRGLTQYVSREDRPITVSVDAIVSDDNADPAFLASVRTSGERIALPPGWINERVQVGDWQIHEGVPPGEVFYGSNWPEVSLLLSAFELPSIYVDLVSGAVWSLDVFETNLEGNVLRITNPTDSGGKASVFVDSEGSRSVAWDYPWSSLFASVSIPAGETVALPIAPSVQT